MPGYRELFPLFISQDGDHTGIKAVAEGFAPAVQYMQHLNPVQGTVDRLEAYQRIALHYKFVFKQLFDCFGYMRVIVLEVCSSFPYSLINALGTHGAPQCPVSRVLLPWAQTGNSHITIGSAAV